MIRWIKFFLYFVLFSNRILKNSIILRRFWGHINVIEDLVWTEGWLYHQRKCRIFFSFKIRTPEANKCIKLANVFFRNFNLHRVKWKLLIDIFRKIAFLYTSCLNFLKTIQIFQKINVVASIISLTKFMLSHKVLVFIVLSR